MDRLEPRRDLGEEMEASQESYAAQGGGVNTPSGKIWDWNSDPKSSKRWQIADLVWLDLTLFIVDRFDGESAVLKPYVPVNIRKPNPPPPPDIDGLLKSSL